MTFKDPAILKATLSGSLGIDAVAGNGKLLEVRGNLTTGVVASGQLVIAAKDAGDKFETAVKLESKWDGVKGEISWLVLNGKWSGKHACIIADKKQLTDPKRIVIFPRS